MTECLSRLLFPLEANTFLQHYQAREYFHVTRTSPAYYADLLTVNDVDRVLQSGQLPAAFLNVVKNGVRCPIEEWSRFAASSRGVCQVAIPEELLNLYSDGATLILNHAQDELPALRNTCASLTQELGFPTQTNIYITPANSVGFVKHSDEHDVLILQVSGSKLWTIYPFDATPLDIDLQTGDLLYIPRGMFHAARSEESSIHITLGLRPLYGFQLVHALANLVCEMEIFQAPMPPLFAGGDAVRAFETDVLARLKTLMDAMKPATLTDRHRDELTASQAEVWPGRFADLQMLPLITIDTVVRRRPGISATVREDGRLLGVEFGDTQVTVPVFMRDELPRVLGASEFAIREIGGMVTDPLKLRFVAEFVKAGILQIVSV